MPSFRYDVENFREQLEKAGLGQDLPKDLRVTMVLLDVVFNAWTAAMSVGSRSGITDLLLFKKSFHRVRLGLAVGGQVAGVDCCKQEAWMDYNGHNFYAGVVLILANREDILNIVKADFENFLTTFDLQNLKTAAKQRLPLRAHYGNAPDSVLAYFFPEKHPWLVPLVEKFSSARS